jgi:hypothetical protein
VAGRRSLPDDPEERARASFDLVILSVLLDAGSGPGWRYHDRRRAGASRGRRAWPSPASGCSKQARCAISITGTETLCRGFQVSQDNPLAGLEGRAELLRRLGRQIAARPDLFAGRPGGLFDVLATRRAGRLPAPAILELVLEALGPIWAGG